MANENKLAGTHANIAIRDLYLSPLNTYDLGDLTELMESIRSYGLLTPLTVCGPDESGKYEVLSGNRRLSAMKNMGYEEETPIDCMILEQEITSDQEKIVLIETCNLNSRVLSPAELETHRQMLLTALLQLAEREGTDECHVAVQFAAAIGKTPRYARLYRQVFRDLIPELKEISTEHHIPLQLQAEVSKLPVEEQKQIVEQTKDEPSSAKVKNILKNKATYKAAYDPGDVEEAEEPDEEPMQSIESFVDSMWAPTPSEKKATAAPAFTDKRSVVRSWIHDISGQAEIEEEDKELLRMIAEIIDTMGLYD